MRTRLPTDASDVVSEAVMNFLILFLHSSLSC